MFNLANYKDRNFILLLVAMTLCFSSFQTILTPSIDYIALSIKNNNHMFYSYATIASLVSTIPQASALISGYLVNNFIYKKAINLIFCLIVILGVVAFFYHQSFNIYVIFVIMSGILSVALYCNVDRQIVILLADKIRDFQNDSFILASILSMINYKFSNLLFSNYGLSGIILYNLLLNTIAYICLHNIPAVDKIIADPKHQSSLPNLKFLVKVFLKHPPLLAFWGIMLTIMFASSGFILLLTTKIHHEGISNSVWASNMALMSFGILLGSLVCKTNFMRNINSIKVICFGEVVYGLCLIMISSIHSIRPLFLVIWFCGFMNPFILINMNTLFFKYIAKNEELIVISPIVNGALTSAFYIVCLIGPILTNYFLQINLSYTLLLVLSGIAEIILGLLLINAKIVRSVFAQL